MSMQAEGYAAGLVATPRNANPYARGWSRHAVLVMPDSLAAEWDRGWQLGFREWLAKQGITNAFIGTD